MWTQGQYFTHRHGRPDMPSSPRGETSDHLSLGDTWGDNRVQGADGGQNSEFSGVKAPSLFGKTVLHCDSANKDPRRHFNILIYCRVHTGTLYNWDILHHNGSLLTWIHLVSHQNQYKKKSQTVPTEIYQMTGIQIYEVKSGFSHSFPWKCPGLSNSEWCFRHTRFSVW